MKCSECPHYKSGYLYNACAITGAEYFSTKGECTIVNKDGSLNYNDEYVQMEFGRDKEISKTDSN